MLPKFTAKTATEKEMKVIYAIDGDTLRVAMSIKGPEGPLPDSLGSKEAILFTFKRVGKK